MPSFLDFIIKEILWFIIFSQYFHNKFYVNRQLLVGKKKWCQQWIQIITNNNLKLKIYCEKYCERSINRFIYVAFKVANTINLMWPFLCTCQQTMIATAYKMFEERFKRALKTEVDKWSCFFFEEQVDKWSDYKIITLPNFSFITYVRVYYL